MRTKILIIIAVTLNFWNCKKDYITETEIGKIESSTVFYLGDEYVEVYFKNTELDKGICYSEKDSIPTIDDHVNYITHWSYDGSYMVKLENLKEGITYYCRVFIKQEDAVAYGNMKSFTMKKTPTGWTRKADFAGEARYNTIGFSIGNKGYMGLGSSGGWTLKDIWEYHPASNSWTQKVDFPDRGQITSVGFAIGNKGYAMVGLSEKFWEYDPATNHWTRKADFPGELRHYAVGFAISNKGYMGTGYVNNKLYKDFWEYDPATNHWTRKADFAGGIRYNATGFSIGNKGYIAMGFNTIYGAENKDFWEYDPATNHWTQKADFAGGKISDSFGFAIGNKGYIGNENSGNVWEYNPVSNSWTQKANFVGKARSHAAVFAIGNKGYIGTGHYSASQRLQDFWEFKP